MANPKASWTYWATLIWRALRLSLVWGIVITLVLLVLYCLCWGAGRFWHVILSADPNVSVAIIAGSVTVSVSVLSVVVGRYLENRARIAQELRERKAPIYEELQKFFFSALFAEAMGKKRPSEKEMVAFFAGFLPRLSVWGSDEVIRAFVEFRRYPSEKGPPKTRKAQMELLQLYEKTVLQIRLDLGHHNVGLKPGVLLSLHIIDALESDRPHP